MSNFFILPFCQKKKNCQKFQYCHFLFVIDVYFRRNNVNYLWNLIKNMFYHHLVSHSSYSQMKNKNRFLLRKKKIFFFLFFFTFHHKILSQKKTPQIHSNCCSNIIFSFVWSIRIFKSATIVTDNKYDWFFFCRIFFWWFFLQKKKTVVNDKKKIFKPPLLFIIKKKKTKKIFLLQNYLKTQFRNVFHMINKWKKKMAFVLKKIFTFISSFFDI